MSGLVLKLIDAGADGPSLRGTTDKDGNPAFSLFDLGNISCKREKDNQYGKNIFYRLIKDESKFKDEVPCPARPVRGPQGVLVDLPDATRGDADRGGVASWVLRPPRGPRGCWPGRGRRGPHVRASSVRHGPVRVPGTCACDPSR
jgi:hypothetical protein